MNDSWLGSATGKDWCLHTTQEISSFSNRKAPEAGDVVVLLPVGSCEQHGAHLPIGTDTLIGFLLAKESSKRCKCPILTLPPIWLGYSPHHIGMSGTLTLSEETFIQIIYEICFNLVNQGFEKIILLNSHGGNTPCLTVAVNKIGRQSGISPIVTTYWQLIYDQIDNLRKSPFGGMGHAGEFETALALYLFPELVKIEKAIPSPQAGDKYFSPEMFAKNIIYHYVDYLKLSPSGVVGNPLAGTAQGGKQLFVLLVNKLCELIEDFSGGNMEIFKLTRKEKEEYENH